AATELESLPRATTGRPGSGTRPLAAPCTYSAAPRHVAVLSRSGRTTRPCSRRETTHPSGSGTLGAAACSRASLPSTVRQCTCHCTRSRGVVGWRGFWGACLRHDAAPPPVLDDRSATSATVAIVLLHGRNRARRAGRARSGAGARPGLARRRAAARNRRLRSVWAP